MAMCHFYLWNIRCRPNLKIHLTSPNPWNKSLSYRKITKIHLVPPLIISLCFQSVFQIAHLEFFSTDSHKQAGQLVLLLSLGLSFSVYIVGVQKTKIMASGPITSWQISGETMETVTDFIFLGSKITADGDCSHEIKRCLLLGRKAMTNIDSILKSRDITLPTKVHLVKAVVFPVVTYECESWTIKKAKHWRSDAFALWCWRRLSRVPWTARRSNQSILKEISPFL